MAYQGNLQASIKMRVYELEVERIHRDHRYRKTEFRSTCRTLR